MNFYPGQAVKSKSFGSAYTVVKTGSVVCTLRSKSGHEVVYPTAALVPVES